MMSGGVLKTTVIGCALAAAVAIVAGVLTDHPVTGAGLAVGLVLGSANGFLLRELLSRGTPFVAGTLMRIVLFSSLVLMAAFVLRGSAWTVPLGIGLAQLVLVGAGVREGMRS